MVRITWIFCPGHAGVGKNVEADNYAEDLLMSLSLRTGWYPRSQDIPIAAQPPVLATIE
jgi:hypothetical protein